MSNYKLKLLIRPKEIHNKLIGKQKHKFDNIQITKAVLLDNGEVEIECLVLEEKIEEISGIQVLDFSATEYLSVEDI